jgi:hypothetical protein
VEVTVAWGASVKLNVDVDLISLRPEQRACTYVPFSMSTPNVASLLFPGSGQTSMSSWL